MEETLNIEYHTRLMILVALNTSCCMEGAAKKFGICRRTLKKRKTEYGITRVSGRYIFKKQKRPLQSVARKL